MAVDDLFPGLSNLAHDLHATDGVNDDGGRPGTHVPVVHLGIHGPSGLDVGPEHQLPGALPHGLRGDGPFHGIGSGLLTRHLGVQKPGQQH